MSGLDDGDTADSERGERNRKQDSSNIYSVIRDLGLVLMFVSLLCCCWVLEWDDSSKPLLMVHISLQLIQ